MTTSQMITAALAGGGIMGAIDFLVGVLKVTGRAKNVIHLIGVGIVAAFKAIAADQSQDGGAK